jgi:hypothetical protein
MGKSRRSSPRTNRGSRAPRRSASMTGVCLGTSPLSTCGTSMGLAAAITHDGICRRGHRTNTSVDPSADDLAIAHTRPNASSVAGSASDGLVGLLKPALLLCQERGHGTQAGPGAGSAARRRCRPLGRWSPRRRPPSRTCEFPRIRLSMSTRSGFVSCQRLLDALDRQLLVAAGAQNA